MPHSGRDIRPCPASVATVTYNNVSIEGAGSGQTIINVPSTYSPRPTTAYEGDGLFTFGRALGAIRR